MPDEAVINRLIESARNEYQHKHYNAAAESYRQAAALFKSLERPLDEAEMANNCSVALAMAGDFRAAWEAARGTEVAFLQSGDSRRAGLACGNQAAALEGMGDTKGAEHLYQRSAELLKAAGDADARAAVLKSLAALQAKTGSPLNALASAQAAVNTGAALTWREKALKKLIDVPFQMLQKK